MDKLLFLMMNLKHRSAARVRNSRRRGLDRDDEQPRVGEQGPPVRLNGIGVLEAIAVAGKKFATLLVIQPLQERLQG
jgi:hypothetical protein